MAEWLRRGTQANAFERRTSRDLLMDLSSWVRIPLLSLVFFFSFFSFREHPKSLFKPAFANFICERSFYA